MEIAQNHPDWRLRSSAISQLNDEKFLVKIAQTEKHDIVRYEAEQRLKAVNSGKNGQSNRQAFVLQTDKNDAVAEFVNKDAGEKEKLKNKTNFQFVILSVLVLALAGMMFYFGIKLKKRT